MKLAIMTRTEVLAPESAELVADRIRELAEEYNRRTAGPAPERKQPKAA